jgi:hypothetical protein
MFSIAKIHYYLKMDSNPGGLRKYIPQHHWHMITTSTGMNLNDPDTLKRPRVVTGQRLVLDMPLSTNTIEGCFYNRLRSLKT